MNDDLKLKGKRFLVYGLVPAFTLYSMAPPKIKEVDVPHQHTETETPGAEPTLSYTVNGTATAQIIYGTPFLGFEGLSFRVYPVGKERGFE